MPDEVLPDGGLADGETMRVLERVVRLDSGADVWLRRWVPGEDGARQMLADGRWCATRGGVARMYAAPLGLRGGHEWAYRLPSTYPTWQEALEAARSAEAAWSGSAVSA